MIQVKVMSVAYCMTKGSLSVKLIASDPYYGNLKASSSECHAEC